MSLAQTTNDQLVLICGESKGGKTASLQNLKNPEGVIYLNCESGKKPTFPAKFRQQVITDPLAIYAIFDMAEQEQFKDKVHTIVIDSLTYLMDMYESTCVLTATDTQKAWQNYQQYYKNLMQQYVAKSTKNVIFTAHTLSILNENEYVMEKKVPLRMLEGYENPLLTITPDEESIGIKHVYQTRLTKDTVNERISAPIGMWQIKETYINNDAQLLLDRLSEYYGQSTVAKAA